MKPTTQRSAYYLAAHSAIGTKLLHAMRRATDKRKGHWMNAWHKSRPHYVAVCRWCQREATVHELSGKSSGEALRVRCDASEP